VRRYNNKRRAVFFEEENASIKPIFKEDMSLTLGILRKNKKLKMA